MTSGSRTRRDIEDFFRVHVMAPRDALVFGADLAELLSEDRPDVLNDEQYRRIVLTLSDKGWYQRQSDTLTAHGRPGKADNESNGGGRLLDAKSAANHMGLTESQFRKLSAQGKIPFVPVTGEVRGTGLYQRKRYRAADLERWAAENVVG